MRKKKIYLRRLLRVRPSATSGVYNQLSLGDFGVISTEPGLFSRNQREAIRKILARRLKPINGRYWVGINHFISLTQKSKGARMGKGRGGFSCEKAPIRPGSVICEFKGVDFDAARALHASISKKLPVNTIIVPNSLA